MRLDARQSHRVETLHDQCAAARVARVHLLDERLAHFQRLQRRPLRHRRRGHNQVLVQLAHLGQQGLRPQHIPHAPARHRVGLGEALQHDRSLAHPRQRGETHVLHTVDQPVVDFVRNHHQVVLFREGGNGGKTLVADDGPCWIVGRGEKKRLRLGRDRSFDHLRRHLKSRLRCGGNGYRRSVGHHGYRFVGHKTRFGEDDLIAGIQQGRHRDVERLRHPYRHQDFLVGIIVQPIELVNVRGNRLPQLDQAGIGRVVRRPVPQRRDPGLHNRRRRVEIRLPNA